MTRPPLPPFTEETARTKVRAAGWNSRDLEKVTLAYTPDSRWRNRVEFLRVLARQKRDCRVFKQKVGSRTRLPVDQGTLELV